MRKSLALLLGLLVVQSQTSRLKSDDSDNEPKHHVQARKEAKDIFKPESLRHDYNEYELAYISSLTSLREENGHIGLKLKPRCYFENITATCCLGFDLKLPKKDVPCQICVDAGVRLDTMEAFAGITFNDVELYEQDYQIGKLCWHLPEPLSKIQVCVWVYHMEVSLEDKTFEACTILELNPIFQVDFHCLRYEDGQFSIRKDVSPSDRGIDGPTLVDEIKFRIDSPQGKKFKWWLKQEWRNVKRFFRKRSRDFKRWIKRPF